MSDATQRPLPRPDLQTQPYWDAAQAAELQLPSCPTSGRLLHPSAPCCPDCLRTDLTWRPVSGRGSVRSFCVMWSDFVPGFEPPYVVAQIAIDEQPDVLLLANIFGATPDAVTIGAPVTVLFEGRDGQAIPQFELEASG